MTNTLETTVSAVLALLNRRDFDAFERLVDDDCVLDLPGGSRVVGAQSVRDTLSAYLLRLDARLADIVVMTDGPGHRAAAEVTFEAKGRDAQEDRFTVPGVFLFERENDVLTRISLYLPRPL